MLVVQEHPLPPKMISMAGTGCAQLWQAWCLMLVSPPLPPYPCLPLPLKFGWSWQRRGVCKPASWIASE